MDSEESRPGSSASSSASESSNRSGPSSPDPDNKIYEGPQYPTVSPQKCLDNKSRSRSPSIDGNFDHRRSRSKSNSALSESSSSSDNENDDANSQSRIKRSLAQSSSEEDSIKNEKQQSSHPRSPSPEDSHRSFRNSSSSSNSISNGRTDLDADEAEAEVHISHEDLSDVSDMESEKRTSSNNNNKQYSDDAGVDLNEIKTGRNVPEVNNIASEQKDGSNETCDLREKLDKKKEIKSFENGKHDSDLNSGGKLISENYSNNSASKQIEDLVKTHDEDALDFEAEEGECLEENEIEENNDNNVKATNHEKSEKGLKSDGEAEDGEELEEGEVSDEEEKRPEETEPKPVCRFYTRGQCTWGMSCRFLHPGVTDKGNYTMFDLVRPVPVPQLASTSRSAGYSADYDYRTERPPLLHRPTTSHFTSGSVYSSHHDPRAVIPEAPVVVESAWERGLRTAKEMMRKASKRKEQDMDFEDKKMNLPVSQEELEKDSYYLKERGSPSEAVPSYGRHGAYHDVPSGIYTPPERFGRFAPPLPPYEDLDPYGRSARYRELPPHRMPQYEDERRVRPTREVIVQRVEPAGRGDEWNDPWMRSKSPGARAASPDRVDRRRRDRRSYSTNSSYSSSTSSQSDSSSETSRSPSPAEHRRRYNNSSQKSPSIRRHGIHSARSVSPVGRRGRRSPGPRRSPLIKRRGGYGSPSPTLDKRFTYSPAHKRKRLSPIKKLHDKSKIKRQQTSSSSGSDSSDSSASDSESDTGSSSSDSSSRSRGKVSRHAVRKVPGKGSVDKRILRKVEPPKKRSPITIEIKKPSIVGASALTSPTLSASSEKDTKKSRREELLKQLRAVEDAIAKKRQKLA